MSKKNKSQTSVIDPVVGFSSGKVTRTVEREDFYNQVEADLYYRPFLYAAPSGWNFGKLFDLRRMLGR